MIASLGLGAILLATPMARHNMVFGPEWLTCLICLPLFAIAPFAALVWALRKAAPTDLRRAGAGAGLVAAALGATACAFHCPGDSLPFIAIWYGLPILFWIFLGAILGPRLLRWFRLGGADTTFANRSQTGGAVRQISHRRHCGSTASSLSRKLLDRPCLERLEVSCWRVLSCRSHLMRNGHDHSAHSEAWLRQL